MVQANQKAVINREQVSGRAQLLIHIGYHKTGTTWLQTGILRDEKSGFVKPWDSKIIREQIVFPSIFEFDALQVWKTFEPLLSDASRRSLVAVMTDERLSGSPHAGGYDSAIIADRLAAIFPCARILIVIREQRSAIYSIYQQYVRDGGAALLKYYLLPRNPAEIPQFRFAHFEYHHLIRRYFTNFGRQNVLVLPYEWLLKNPDDFLDRISCFAGVVASHGSSQGYRYSSLGAATILLKRWANFFFVRTSLNPSARFYVKNHERRFERLNRFIPTGLSRRIEKKQREYISSVLANRYQDSNRETSTLIEIDLRKLGYEVSER